MSHQMILEIPNEVYAPLAESAKNTGATPEKLAVDWLAAMSRHAANDPLEKWIGALPGQVPDWTERHDKYLGESLTQTHDDVRAES